MTRLGSGPAQKTGNQVQQTMANTEEAHTEKEKEKKETLLKTKSAFLSAS